MYTKTHIIYIPGFGAKYDWLRSFILSKWRFKGITVDMVPMNWHEGTFDQKMNAINKAVDRAKSKRIVLIGESAGGSMAVHMYAHRPDDLSGVITLCGKNILPETVQQRYIDNSPAFGVSMKNLNNSIKMIPAVNRSKFVSVYPIYDPVVPVNETLLPGCRRKRLLLVGHVSVIFITITVLAKVLVSVARKI